MDHFDRLGNNVDLANADEVWDNDSYVGLPEEDPYFDPEREAMEDEVGASFGDARRCPRHPHIKTSSDDGMFDAECGECEYQSEMAYQRMKEEECPDTLPDPAMADTVPVPVLTIWVSDDIPF